MADSSSSSGGGTSALAFLVGGLMVAVVVLGFFMYTGGHLGNSAPASSTFHVDVHAPAPKPGG